MSPAESAGADGWILMTKAGAGGVGTEVWRSSDGVSWQAAATIPWLTSGDRVSAGPLGFAILGGIEVFGTGWPTVAVSRDGIIWFEAHALRGPILTDVVITDAGFVAMGPNDLLLSSDGAGWTSATGSPTGLVIDSRPRGSLVAWTGSDVLAFGIGDDRAVHAWLGSPTFGAAPHVTWHAVDSRVFAGAGIVAAASSGSRTLVLGYALADLSAIAWTLSGGAWRRVALDSSIFGGGVPGRLTGGSNGFVVVADDVGPLGAPVSVSWASADGITWSAVDNHLPGEQPAATPGPCPAPLPTTLAELDRVGEALAAACFRSRQLTLEGYVAGCDGCGGTSPYVGKPAWLLDSLRQPPRWLADSPLELEARHRIGIWFDPADALTWPEVGTHVRLVGHFNDPASATCRMDPAWGIAEVPPPAFPEATCRSHLVADSVTVLAP